MSGRIVLNNNSVQPLGGPNTGVGTDEGDLWNTVVTNVNTMTADIYAGTSLQAGTSGTFTTGQATLSANVTAIGSANTNTTQTLMSYVLPANVLSAAKKGLLITAWGIFAANAAPKTLQLTVGGVNINSGSVTQNGSSWILTAMVYKTAANAQSELFTAQLGTVFSAPKATTDTSVDTGTINIATTMLDASAASSNVTQYALIVEYMG